jgi:hypothetical protein
MKNTKKTDLLVGTSIVLMLLLLFSLNTFAQVDVRDDVLSAQVEITISVAFGQGTENDDVTPYSIWIALDDGHIHAGDTVVMSPANIEDEWRYIYPKGEEIDLNEDVIDFWYDYDGLQMFAVNGLESFTINNQTYWFTDKQIEASKRLALKALLEI